MQHDEERETAETEVVAKAVLTCARWEGGGLGCRMGKGAVVNHLHIWLAEKYKK